MLRYSHVMTDLFFTVYFLPIWFQSILGVSAVDSGIRLLPLMLSMVVATIVGGFGTQKIGYYTPFAIVGTCIMCVGAGLLTNLQVNTGSGKWIGYQIPYGFGMGLAFQAPNLAAQTVLPTKDVPVGTSLMFFSQILGASIFVSVGENVLGNQLVKRLTGLPGFDPSSVTSGGATSLIQNLPASVRSSAVGAYNESLRQVFLIGLVMSCLTMIGTAGLEWKSVKKEAEAQKQSGSVAIVEEGKEKGAVAGA